MMKEHKKDLRVAIIGGGLVGSLCACLLGDQGVRVQLFETREDVRSVGNKWSGGRSINLALSERGRSALRRAGLEADVIEKHGIPMRGRMLHDVKGRTTYVPYSKDGKCIYSVGRRFLNETLLTAAEKNKNVELFFNHKFLECDLKTGRLQMSNEGDWCCDLVLGCDGAHSAVRGRHVLPLPRTQYSQCYIEHGYVELTISPDAPRTLENGFLHIWPRHSYMMIALPNQDGSYTVTLFAPFDLFEGSIRQSPVKFFEEHFPDALPLIGREQLESNFPRPSALVSIQCHPYHVEDRLLLLGDAAHAMVPFYGQGMNAGFEDCEILMELLDAFSYDLKRVLPAFTARRHDDAVAICDLAMYNYLEMRHLVTSRRFLLRRRIDDFLSDLCPNSWSPLYSMVTFSKLRYSHCVAKKNMQDKVLATCFWSIAVILFSCIIAIFTRI